jgi:hypothetical protein
MCLEGAKISAYTSMGSVTRVVGLPRVYGLRGDEGSFVKVMRSYVPSDSIDNPSLMDRGANICIKGILECGNYPSFADICGDYVEYILIGQLLYQKGSHPIDP